MINSLRRAAEKKVTARLRMHVKSGALPSGVGASAWDEGCARLTTIISSLPPFTERAISKAGSRDLCFVHVLPLLSSPPTGSGERVVDKRALAWELRLVALATASSPPLFSLSALHTSAFSSYPSVRAQVSHSMESDT